MANNEESAQPQQTKPNNGLAEPRERVTFHTIDANGIGIAYAARVGTLLVDSASVKPAASMFYTAYERIDADKEPDPNRPITFAFNGGPGSSTTFLLMGSIGPKRVDVPDLEPATPPYSLVDNPDTILPFTDLVFIDAPGTGFSRVADEAKAEVWSVDGDVAAFSKFIQQYCTLHSRWNSPKYLFGESYGTTRAAALAYRLVLDGVPLSGVTMISNLLDFSFPLDSGDQWFISVFPTYAAIARYHGKAGADEDLDSFLRKARAFANGPLRLALAAGARLGKDVKRRIARKYAELTGLREQYVYDSDLRVLSGRFRKELLRDQGDIVGLYDGRASGPDWDLVKSGETFVVDAAYIDPSYWGLVNSYLRADLGWDGTDERLHYMDFDGSSTIPGKGWVWWHHLPHGVKTATWWGGVIPFPSVVPDLAFAILRQPILKVLIGNGLYDLCTPFFGAEYDIDHAGLPERLEGNIAFTYYPSGHMLYTSKDSLHKFSHDLERFYRSDAAHLSELDERPSDVEPRIAGLDD